MQDEHNADNVKAAKNILNSAPAQRTRMSVHCAALCYNVQFARMHNPLHEVVGEDRVGHSCGAGLREIIQPLRLRHPLASKQIKNLFVARAQGVLAIIFLSL